MLVISYLLRIKKKINIVNIVPLTFKFLCELRSLNDNNEKLTKAIKHILKSTKLLHNLTLNIYFKCLKFPRIF